MEQCKYDAVLFDLDGTVSRSHPGIIGSMKKALAEYGHTMPADFDYFQFIGPPICQSLMEYCHMPEPEAERCTKIYRRIYNDEGIFNTSLYPGLKELMARLQDSGAKVCLATSKPQPMADEVVSFLGIDKIIYCNAGADPSDKVSDKPGLIARCLRETGATKEKTVMIGDTRFDANGAAVAGVHFIGVLYGYGSREEMEEQGAAVFAADAAELAAALFTE